MMSDKDIQWAYLDGQFQPLLDTKISVLDRGFLFGDGIYEVVPVYNRQLFEWPAHYARLERSLALTQISNPLSQQAWLDLLNELIERHPWPNQFIYLQITRGVQTPRDHLPAAHLTPTLLAYTNPLPAINKTSIGRGIAAITHPDLRWQHCDIKAITLLANVIAKKSAQNAQAQDALLVRQNGLVTEGSASNMFLIKDGTIHTPPLNEFILPGITRQVVEKLGTRHHVGFVERDIQESELATADEIWLASSTKEIIPIVTLNHQPVGNGQAGPLWSKMFDLYQDYKREYKQDYRQNTRQD